MLMIIEIIYWTILGCEIGAIAFLLKQDKWKVYPFYALVLLALGAIKAMNWSNTWWIMLLAIPAALLISAVIISQLINLARRMSLKSKS